MLPGVAEQVQLVCTVWIRLWRCGRVLAIFALPHTNVTPARGTESFLEVLDFPGPVSKAPDVCLKASSCPLGLYRKACYELDQDANHILGHMQLMGFLARTSKVQSLIKLITSLLMQRDRPLDGPQSWEEVDAEELARIALHICTNSMPSTDHAEAASRLAMQAANMDTDALKPSPWAGLTRTSCSW